MILTEAKRLFGHYGYLGFTLKQLALACHMTPPAVYYFYSSKADLFRDCLLSEMTIRHQFLSQITQQCHTFEEFARALAENAFEVCGASHFRAGQAMDEIIHLKPEFQQELRTAWIALMIAPVEDFLRRALPAESPTFSHRLLATFFINLATFAAGREGQFGQQELIDIMVAAGFGIEHVVQTSLHGDVCATCSMPCRLTSCFAENTSLVHAE